MAKYFLHVKFFSRGKGSRVTRAAAYRAGERIRDELTSEVYNYGNALLLRHRLGHRAPPYPNARYTARAELTTEERASLSAY